jgi:hypothetical protein
MLPSPCEKGRILLPPLKTLRPACILPAARTGFSAPEVDAHFYSYLTHIRTGFQSPEPVAFVCADFGIRLAFLRDLRYVFAFIPAKPEVNAHGRVENEKDNQV